MTHTDIVRVNNLACNELDQFLFTDHIGCPIGDINITGVDMDAAGGKKNQAQQDPPHKFQATEDAGEDIVIPYTTIDLNINHVTPTEQIQATKEPPEYLIIDTVQPPTTTE